MLYEFSRTELLVGAEGMERLRGAHVAVFGVGGVGSFACEAVARAGVGAITLIDSDTVSVTNRNRQLIALASTVGKNKVDVMRGRIADINPGCRVTALNMFFTPESDLDLTQFDYVIDAIDTVTAKLFLIEQCCRKNIPIICSMGTGNKLDPTKFEVADISKTHGCPLAKVIRLECKKRGIKKLRVVFSPEPPVQIPPERYESAAGDAKGTAGRPVPASISFVPPVAGFILAGEVIKDLAGINK
ncbi:MAG: tRNA threonylcarbamoyladenosine dehydratase [Butyricicoccus sp.]|nr:tRNA threonylcarbamoyladenosine dehydratase [Butyricicoccus sp.]MBQ8585033.1 tRNA threonylcarbamoyladenosine dehydratase [Butyricicoccus sp.]